MRKRVFKTTHKSLLTLFYWRLNGEEINHERFLNMIKHEGFRLKPTYTRSRLNVMIRRGFVYIVDGSVRLTDDGMWLMEQRESVLSAMIFGHIMQGVTSRDELRKIYLEIGQKVTGNTVRDRTDLILKRLRREGGIDYTRDRVWVVRKIEIRKEDLWEQTQFR